MFRFPLVSSRPRTLRVTIFEDDLWTSQAYQWYLEDQGYVTRSFTENEACRRAIRRQRPDILICDIQSDYGETGLHLLEDLYDEWGQRMPPTIIATAYEPTNLRNSPILRGLPIVRFLFKPFDFDRFSELIGEMVPWTA